MKRWRMLAACAAVTAGCGGDATGTDPLQPGEASVVVTGAVSVRFDGTATSSPRNRAYPQSAVDLFDAATNQVRVHGDHVNGFHVGSTPIGIHDGEAFAEFYLADGTHYTIATGSLMVESVTEDGVMGRAEFDAVDPDFADAAHTVHVRADFNAKRLPVPGG